jgi:tetratricopeptide (TPR) repeat protein
MSGVRNGRRLAEAGWAFPAAALCALVLLASTAGGEEAKPRPKPKPQTRRVESSGKWAYTRLSRAQEALAAGKTAQALTSLNEMKGKLDSLSANEKAMMWQSFGYVYSQQEQYAQAVDSFEKCLAEGALPEQAVVNTRYNLAQLYLVLEKYQKAIENFEIWFAAAENPSADAHYMLAAAYSQAEQPSKALPYARKAVAKAPAPKEAWLQLLLSLDFQLKEYGDATSVLRALIATFPKKTYWLQLAAAYSELGDRKRALATMELAYEQGFLTQEGELKNLAQLYLFNELPFAAAVLLEKELAAHRIASNVGNWQMLADTWLQARERKRAIPALERAAELSDDGNLYARLGQVHAAEEDWPAARKSLAAALAKGGLRDPADAQLMLGIANASESRWKEARTAFAAAQKYEKTRGAAAEWLQHIDEELTLDGYEKALEEGREATGEKEAAPQHSS